MDQDNDDLAATVRTADGLLHIVWRQDDGDVDASFYHRALPADGSSLGPVTEILDAWDTLTNPGLDLLPGGGLRLVFAGDRGGALGDPYNGGFVYTMTSDPAVTTWTLFSGTMSAGSETDSSSISVAHTGDGTPIAVFEGATTHLGTDPTFPATTPDVDHHPWGCCAYNPNIATDEATGDVYIDWGANAAAHYGLWTKNVTDNTEPVRAPNSFDGDTTVNLGDVRNPLVAREGGGIYTAYCKGWPSCDKVLLWRVDGAHDPIGVPGSKGAKDVYVARGLGTRLWVMWRKAEALFAVHTDPTATHFGQVVKITPPPDTSLIWKVTGDGGLGPLDMIVNVSDSEANTFHWAKRIFPGLTLTADPSRFQADAGARVRFTVTDAGSPVEGALVRVGGRSGTTNGSGKVTLRIRPGARRTYTAKATYDGYTADTVEVKAR